MRLDLQVKRRNDSGVLELRFEKGVNHSLADPTEIAMAIAHEEDRQRKEGRDRIGDHAPQRTFRVDVQSQRRGRGQVAC